MVYRHLDPASLSTARVRWDARPGWTNASRRWGIGGPRAALAPSADNIHAGFRLAGGRCVHNELRRRHG